MTQTLRATEKAERRASFLREAGHLFALKGFRAVTIDDIGDAVGVSGPALYRHFASKEAMLSELLLGASERLLERFHTIAAAGGSDWDVIQSLITAHLDFALQERDVIRIQDRELANLPVEINRRVRKLQRQYISGWSQILSGVRPELRPAELAVTMHAVFGILNSTPYSARLDSSADVRAILQSAALAALLGAGGDGCSQPGPARPCR